MPAELIAGALRPYRLARALGLWWQDDAKKTPEKPIAKRSRMGAHNGKESPDDTSRVSR